MGYITLSKKSFVNNADYYCDILGSVNNLCIALKDNAYGHGIQYIAQLSLEYGIKHCIVRDINEATQLEKFEFETILVLYEIPNKLYNHNCIFSINTLEKISLYPKGCKVELKIDTGMCRNGIRENEINEALELIKQNKLILNGVFTHFCCADENNENTNKQENIFNNIVSEIKNKISYSFRVHCANTHGVHKVNNNLYDMARIGIGMYGYSSIAKDKLKPVLSLYAKKISTRVLNIEDKIGYGASYKIQKNNTIVSNYDIGYADGFFRINETQKAFIENKKQILGRVSMDSFSILGDDDEVCVFSNATHFANIHNTIEYEILTQLMPRIKKIII